MTRPRKCQTCGKKAGPSGELWTTVEKVFGPNLEIICSKCFQVKMETNETGREATKDHIADLGFLREEQYESEREYLDSQHTSGQTKL